METLRKQSLFVLAAIALTTTCRAQTAEDIVNKSIDAVGGKDKIAAVKSIIYNQTLEVMGQEVSTVTTVVAGKGFKSETDFNGTKYIQCMTDHGAWAINPMAGQTTATALPDDQWKPMQGRLNIVPLIGWSANGGKLELQGKDTADYKIHMTNTNGADVVYYINQKSYLLDKSDLNVNISGQAMTITTHLSDYRKTDAGVVVPWAMVIDQPQMSLTFTTKSVDVNKPVDPTFFDMPK